MVVYFLGSRRRAEAVQLSNVNGHSHGEQRQFYINDVHDETDDFDGVNLPPKLLKLQLLCTNEGMHQHNMVGACSQCYIHIYCWDLHVDDSSDASDIIQGRLNVINHKPRSFSDAFNMICESGLNQSTWQAQIEKAVESETGDFWTKV